MEDLILIIIMGIIGLTFWLRHIYINHKPIKTVNAKIVDMTTKPNRNRAGITSFSYFIIFRYGNGAKIELQVNDLEYKRLNKFQRGKLTYQHDRYYAFILDEDNN
ncbi:DUF2500 domain-containing protein [Vallitalea okinawensis]|uniref:DUF2500 domain-containing protein n=1 Tax=Vallitalea okinawensis TaxID=2078660 RepID=UPI000CFC3D1D|nr:DUF2500 domain-containing protein [Vallitalea okinawensis]